MVQHLTDTEIAQLKAARFSTVRLASDLSIELNELMNQEKLLDYIERVSDRIGSPDLKVSSSIFMKRFAFLAVNYLYSMTVFNKRLDVSFDNISIETPEDVEQWLPLFYFENKTAVELDCDRNEWRRDSLRQLFRDNLYPLMDEIMKATKISKLILWENVAIYIFWLYEKKLFQHDDEEIRTRAREDFRYLIYKAPGNVFGDYNRNPLQKYHSSPVFIKEYGEEVRVRTSCCFYYKLEDSEGRCKTCPQQCKKLM